jgi:hypothetical protein
VACGSKTGLGTLGPIPTRTTPPRRSTRDDCRRSARATAVAGAARATPARCPTKRSATASCTRSRVAARRRRAPAPERALSSSSRGRSKAVRRAPAPPRGTRLAVIRTKEELISLRERASRERGRATLCARFRDNPITLDLGPLVLGVSLAFTHAQVARRSRLRLHASGNA